MIACRQKSPVPVRTSALAPPTQRRERWPAMRERALCLGPGPARVCPAGKGLAAGRHGRAGGAGAGEKRGGECFRGGVESETVCVSRKGEGAKSASFVDCGYILPRIMCATLHQQTQARYEALNPPINASAGHRVSPASHSELFWRAGPSLPRAAGGATLRRLRRPPGTAVQ